MRKLFAYLFHLILSQFCLTIRLPRLTESWMASTCYAIARVIRVIAEAQVVKVAARWIVAVVQYILSIWNWPIREFPREAVGQLQVIWINTNDAISTFVAVARPNDTVTLLLKTGLKPNSGATINTHRRAPPVVPALRWLPPCGGLVFRSIVLPLQRA